MSLTIWHLIILVPIFLLIESFFSGSEIALLSADKILLRNHARKGSRGAKTALELTMRPEQVLSTTLFMTNFCVVGISAMVVLYLLAHSYRQAELIAVAVSSPLIVLLGELVPKTIYQRYANQIAPYIAYPVKWSYLAFFPITRLLASYTSRISRMVAPVEALLIGKRRTTRDELRSLISIGKSDSEIKTSEKRMIKRIFDFKDTEAKHALIPLVKVDAIEECTRLREALEKFQSHRHSRMPVYRDRIDNIIGVLEVFELLGAADLEQPIRNFVQPAFYAPETQALEDLIRDMRVQGREMSIVVDEYGGAVGILTFEDIVEEIVGEINDEYDSDSTLYKELSGTSWIVQAKVEIQQLNEALQLAIPEGDYDTLGGFLLQQFGRIPEPRDELYFDTRRGPLRFTIRKATERAIQSVLVEILFVPEEERRTDY